MLTDLAIRSLPTPEKGVKRYWDKDGLCVQVSQGGSKTFYLVQGTERKFLKLGRYGVISLADARLKVKQILAAKTLGTYTEPDQTTVDDALKLFIVMHEEKNKASTVYEIKRLLGHLAPLHKYPLETVTTRDLLDLINEASSSISERRHLFAACRGFFRWCARQRMIKLSPLHDLQPPGKQVARDRVLTDTELVAIYRAAQQMEFPFGTIVLLCIHCAFRTNEVAWMRWDYITPAVITLPPAATKNSREHVLPNLVGEILVSIPRTSEYLFPSSAGTPFNAWSKNKKRLDEISKVTDWTLHDLRRTAASKMAEWQCGQPHVIERILNHVSGSMSPLARTYNRHTYLAEMRECLVAYQSHLAALITPK